MTASDFKPYLCDPPDSLCQGRMGRAKPDEVAPFFEHECVVIIQGKPGQMGCQARFFEKQDPCQDRV